ncbi:Immunity protein Imm1 [Amycolatopsis lurida]|uniref:Immunity protein Imm1 n=1 Tax=Amycolatopsis lurida NRRL 2430 TaxID=1460371 RepID=A0A2P2FVN3_AMYLU|nr:Imm1 family immunity protein [Amycolatopsis lurida]KFU80772.1 hypothetical protein BB31_12535 [Amycolatopsis lurida NRRL 2430]SED85815.1 Immunity protein Imm1 [Amycolatopsis lurida]
MVALEIWYDQTPDNELSEGDPAIVVTTPSELDQLIERILRETADHVAPPMIQVALAGVERSPVLEVGLGKEKGFIGYTSRTEGGWTVGDGDPDAVVEYIYSGNVSEVPASVEVPMADVRWGVHEFLRTGERPSMVENDV